MVTKSNLLSNAELAEDHVEQILDIDAAGDAADGAYGQAEILGKQLEPWRRQGALQGIPALLQRLTVPLPGYGGNLAQPGTLDHRLAQSRQKIIQAGAGTRRERKGRAAIEAQIGRHRRQVALVDGEE